MSSLVRPPNQLVDQLERLQVHDHLCLVYETPAQQLSAAVPFMRIGLERGEQCVYIADENSASRVLESMQGGRLDIAPFLASGALRVITKQDAYLKQGCFDPDWMIDFLKKACDSARADGYAALRATGEMTWALGGDPGSDRLIEYEAKLNEFFPYNDVVAICQYNRNRFRPDVIRSVIQTHPIMVYGYQVSPNDYYVPPREYLGHRDPQREVSRLLHHVTERQRTEDALRENEERTRRLYGAVQAGIVLQSVDGSILHANRVACTILGLEEEELIQKTLLDPHWKMVLEDGSPVSVANHPFMITIRNGVAMQNSVVGVLAGDAPTMRWLLVSTEPIADPATGALSQALITFNDITERKQAEQRLVRDRTHLEVLVQERTEALANSHQALQRAERLASLGTLSSGIAHEINNPIGMILLSAENALAATNGLQNEDTVRTCLAHIVDNAERCGRITRSVLQFAKEERTEKWPENVNEIVEDAVRVARKYHKNRSGAVLVRLAPETHTVCVNPIEIQQVLVNLIHNALEAANGQGDVTIRTETAHDAVRIAVRDNGPGIPSAHLKHVFDPFFTTRREDGGTGLGLSIVHGIINDHGGSIEVKSEPGRGTTFTVVLPLVDTAETKHDQSACR